MEKISAKSWMRFLTPKLGVASELMGACHEFIFGGYNIKIILPRKDQADKGEERYDEIAIASVWHSSASEEPIEFSILEVDVEIDLKENIRVPVESATKSMRIDMRVFDNDPINKERISNITKKYAEISNKAFQYWLDLLRWSANCPFFGKQSSQSNNSACTIYLQDKKTGNNVFFLQSATISVSLYPSVTVAEWELTQEKLTNNLQLPMYIKFKFDAQESMEIGNYERAIIELAMACEIYLRYSYFDYLPKDQLHKEVIEYIEKANISQYLNQFFKKIVIDKEKPKFKIVKKDISSLMDERNSYMHMGVMKDATLEKSKKYLSAVEDLFSIGKS